MAKLATAGGGVAGPATAVDNSLVLFDGTTGRTIKAPSGTATISGSQLTLGAASAQGTLFLHDSGAGGTSGVILANSGTVVRRTLTLSNTTWTANHIVTLPNEDITVVGVDNAQTLTAKTLTDPLFAGGTKFKGFTSSTGAASVTELPDDKNFSIHKNTTSGAIVLAYNDGGAIKTVALV